MRCQRDGDYYEEDKESDYLYNVSHAVRNDLYDSKEVRSKDVHNYNENKTMRWYKSLYKI